MGASRETDREMSFIAERANTSLALHFANMEDPSGPEDNPAAQILVLAAGVTSPQDTERW